jgi:hypothetical protein
MAAGRVCAARRQLHHDGLSDLLKILLFSDAITA